MLLESSLWSKQACMQFIVNNLSKIICDITIILRENRSKCFMLQNLPLPCLCSSTVDDGLSWSAVRLTTEDSPVISDVLLLWSPWLLHCPYRGDLDIGHKAFSYNASVITNWPQHSTRTTHVYVTSDMWFYAEYTETEESIAMLWLRRLLIASLRWESTSQISPSPPAIGPQVYLPNGTFATST